ncbi:transcriptional regulator, TetR family [Actinomadura meyerae]|jgi:AcrR family transcriptional regulator|uniref:Transcriptional regulator, TetR family n=1 Tax=Actinomadura meyerae TaxID=240840 RepID=A0A239HH15_9ACTN|nr:TetR/AcrR family transcriptional regulator [Actinomadura meyerae]SNS80338.1 transcriptional regulator, TetR family [Actinomadura meyerae]
MAEFQRARSREQREQRRRAILDTTAGMLAELPVARIGLNELSRRAGLAKSNVLRYFESREAILLELLDRAWTEWNADLPALLDAALDPAAPVRTRTEDYAAVYAASLADRPVLCDLLSAQAGVLEHNVSADVAARYKKAAVANRDVLTELTRSRVPELGDAAQRFCSQAIMVTGAIWTHSQPSPAMRRAYAADPALAALAIEFVPTLQQTVATLIAGALARADAAPPGTR